MIQKTVSMPLKGIYYNNHKIQYAVKKDESEGYRKRKISNQIDIQKDVRKWKNQKKDRVFANLWFHEFESKN